MKGRMVACVLTALLVTALAAMPAAGQERAARGVPSELWDGPAPRSAPAAGEDSGGPLSTLLLTALALGAAALGGYLLTGVRTVAPTSRPAAPPPAAPPAPAAQAPEPPEPAPTPPRFRSRAPRVQGCSITLSRSTTTSEFRVVIGKGAERRVVGRSRRFPAPRSGPLPDEGPPRAAFDELVARLESVGWLLVGGESDVWHRVQLVRPRVDESAALEQAVIDVYGDGFAAFAFDDYGNRLRVAERAVGINESPEDAHAELVAQLETDGWEVAGESEPWYATTLTRRGLALVP
ncbi:MAG TPA: hypothetical protein VFX51_13330 [Solirubrobacteraceae bacterium]|nr:hypothetical protein [Solirubrobacteraceae bacterium]